MKIHFINVGYGDAIFIEAQEFPKRINILIDGGLPDGPQYQKPGRICALSYLRALDIRKIDVMVATHPHLDHVGGLAKIARVMPVSEFWCGLPADCFSGRMLSVCGNEPEQLQDGLLSLNTLTEVFKSVKRRGRIKWINARPQPVFECAELSICCLWPNAYAIRGQAELARHIYATPTRSLRDDYIRKFFSLANQNSMIFRVDCGSRSVLLCGDADGAVWSCLMARPEILHADILKLPHHGHVNCISKEAAAAVSPSNVVVSVSNDRDDCPDSSVLDSIRAQGAVLSVTDGPNASHAVCFDISSGEIIRQNGSSNDCGNHCSVL